MMKKLMKLIIVLIVAFNLVFLMPISKTKEVKAGVFIPALVNPATWTTISTWLTGAAAGGLAVYEGSKAIEYIENIWDDIQSKLLTWGIETAVTFAVEEMKNGVIPMYLDTPAFFEKLSPTLTTSILYEELSQFEKKLSSPITITYSPHWYGGEVSMESYYPKFSNFYPDRGINLRFDFKASETGLKFFLLDSHTLSNNIPYMVEFSGLTYSSYWSEMGIAGTVNGYPHSNSIESPDLIPLNSNNSNLDQFRSFENLYYNYLLPQISNRFLLMVVDSSVNVVDYVKSNYKSLNINDYFPSIDSDTPIYIPLPRAKTKVDYDDIPAGTDLVYNPSTNQWLTDAGIVWTGSDELLDFVYPNVTVQTDANGNVITNADGTVATQVETETGVWVDTATGEIVQGGTGTEIVPPVPPDTGSINWNKLLKALAGFTHVFPFSIPWDIERAVNAVFGTFIDSNTPPVFEFSLDFNGKKYQWNIEIPPLIHEWMPFARAIVVIGFDVSIIYAVYRWFGGAT